MNPRTPPREPSRTDPRQHRSTTRTRHLRDFGEGLSLQPWLVRATQIGLGLVAVGAFVGGLLGLLFGVEWGGIAGLCIVAIGGIVVGMMRLGGAGFGLGIVGGIAALLGASELRYAAVVHGEIEPLASLADWDPASGPSRVRIAPVTKGERFATAYARTYRGSKGGSTTVGYAAAPWMEGERIVGYGCVTSSRRGASSSAGTVALSVEARDGFHDENCDRAVEQSERWALRAGVAIAPNASRRIVRIYASEAELRADHDAAKALWAPTIFLAVYLTGVLVVRLVQARRAGGRDARARG